MAHVHLVTDNNNQTRKKFVRLLLSVIIWNANLRGQLGAVDLRGASEETAMPPRARLLGDKPSYLVCGGD